jgi:hypothetical protein
MMIMAMWSLPDLIALNQAEFLRLTRRELESETLAGRIAQSEADAKPAEPATEEEVSDD